MAKAGRFPRSLTMTQRQISDLSTQLLQLLKQWHWSLQPDTGRHSHKVLWCIDELRVWFGSCQAVQRAERIFHTTHKIFLMENLLFKMSSIKVISLIIIRIEYEPVIQIVSADQLREENICVSAHSPGGILANLETNIFKIVGINVSLTSTSTMSSS